MNRSLSFARVMLLDAAITWELSDALSSIYTVIYDRLELLAPLSRPYSTDELRYEIRMRPFSPIELPELPTFADFSRSTQQSEKPTADLLKAAESAVVGAKRGYEALTKFSKEEAFTLQSHDRWLAAAKNGFKSVIQAGLAVTALKQVMEMREKGEVVNVKVEVPKPGKVYHEWWIVPSVTILT